MLHLVLVRHGATVLNEQQRYQGITNVSLSAAGERQARALRPALLNAVTAMASHAVPQAASQVAPHATTPGGSNAANACVVFSSDMKRAIDTAAHAWPDIAPEATPLLRELDFGLAEGLTFAEARSRLGSGFARWVAEPERVTSPGGEGLESLRERCRLWLADLPCSGHVLAFSHAGWIRALLGELYLRTWSDIQAVDLPCGSAVHLLIDAARTPATPVFSLPVRTGNRLLQHTILP